MWQPIETAPKTKEDILVGWYEDPAEHENGVISPPSNMWNATISSYEDTDWRRGFNHRNGPYMATHWAPIPKPPREQTGGSEMNETSATHIDISWPDNVAGETPKSVNDILNAAAEALMSDVKVDSYSINTTWIVSKRESKNGERLDTYTPVRVFETREEADFYIGQQPAYYEERIGTNVSKKKSGTLDDGTEIYGHGYSLKMLAAASPPVIPAIAKELVSELQQRVQEDLLAIAALNQVIEHAQAD